MHLTRVYAPNLLDTGLSRPESAAIFVPQLTFSPTLGNTEVSFCALTDIHPALGNTEVSFCAPTDIHPTLGNTEVSFCALTDIHPALGNTEVSFCAPTDIHPALGNVFWGPLQLPAHEVHSGNGGNSGGFCAQTGVTQG